MKTSWKTLAGLGAAALAFLKLSEDSQIHDLIPNDTRGGVKPTCPWPQSAKLQYDAGLNVYSWACVYDPVKANLPRGGR